MTSLRAPRPSFGVLPRGHSLLLAGLLALVAGGGAGRPSAAAQEKGSGGEGAKREKTEEEKLLEALGRQWKAGDAAGIGKRIPEKGRVSLRLPGMTGGEYRREQALSLLEDYFDGRSFSKVELKSVKEEVGTFAVEYTRSSDRKKVEAELVLTLGKEKKKRVLVGARESP